MHPLDAIPTESVVPIGTCQFPSTNRAASLDRRHKTLSLPLRSSVSSGGTCKSHCGHCGASIWTTGSVVLLDHIPQLREPLKVPIDLVIQPPPRKKMRSNNWIQQFQMMLLFPSTPKSFNDVLYEAFCIHEAYEALHICCLCMKLLHKALHKALETNSI